MAVGFPKPRFSYEYNLKNEKKSFDRFFTDPQRGIPKKTNKQRKEIKVSGASLRSQIVVDFIILPIIAFVLMVVSTTV